MSADLPVPDPLIALGFGLAVFPIRPGVRRPDAGWQQACRANAAAVARSWRAGDNVGVGCRASHIVVLDLDRCSVDGLASFAKACCDHEQPWPVTLHVRTPSGGGHLYFRAPAGRIVLNSSGGVTALGPGVDVRAPGRRTGGFVLGPSSIVDGTAYEVVVNAPLLPLPAWISDLIAESDRVSVAPGMLVSNTVRRRQGPVGGGA